MSLWHNILKNIKIYRKKYIRASKHSISNILLKLLITLSLWRNKAFSLQLHISLTAPWTCEHRPQILSYKLVSSKEHTGDIQLRQNDSSKWEHDIGILGFVYRWPHAKWRGKRTQHFRMAFENTLRHLASNTFLLCETISVKKTKLGEHI